MTVRQLLDAMTAAAANETLAVRAHLAAGEPATHPALDHAQAAYRAAREEFEAAWIWENAGSAA
jgi:hypothetical protein